MAESIALAVGSGVLVGFSLALTGGGGSILATPLLLYVVGLAPPHVAIGTSAAAVCLNAFINMHRSCPRRHGAMEDRDHLRDRRQLWGLVRFRHRQGRCRPRAAAVLRRPDDRGRALDVAATQGRSGCRGEGAFDAISCTIALAVGLTAGFFGIGGGFLVVPGLVLTTGMPMINAIGSSLLVVASFGLTTALNYAAAGLVDWQVAGEFVVGGTIGGLVGLKLAIYLAAYRGALTRIFAAVIFVVAAYVIYRSA